MILLMLRLSISRYGSIKTTILITVVSVVLSVLITTFIGVLFFKRPNWLLDLIPAAIIPLIVAPLSSYFLCKIVDDLYIVENKLRLKNNMLEAEITQRIQIEDELKAQNAELDAFAHTVAHDLKTPVSVINNYAGMLRKYPERISSEKQREYLDTVFRQGYKMTSIIDSLLTLSRVRNKKEVDVAPLDMDEIVNEAIGRLSKTFRKQEFNITVFNKPLPIAIGYAPWVEEVWVNYISNALKYGGQPSSIELGGSAMPDGNIQFWVQDNGRELSLNEQTDLFTPFERLHRSSIKLEGHGLGLSIVQRIVTRLDGEVGILNKGNCDKDDCDKDDCDKGNRFYFTLPSANMAAQSFV